MRRAASPCPARQARNPADPRSASASARATPRNGVSFTTTRCARDVESPSPKSARRSCRRARRVRPARRDARRGSRRALRRRVRAAAGRVRPRSRTRRRGDRGGSALAVRERACSRARASAAAPARAQARRAPPRRRVAGRPSTLRRTRSRRPRDTSGASENSRRARSRVRWPRRARRARVLPVEQHGAVRVDEHVAGVQVAVHEARLVHAAHQRAERREQGAPRSGGAAQRFGERRAVDPAKREQTVAVRERAERERFRHRDAGRVHARRACATRARAGASPSRAFTRSRSAWRPEPTRNCFTSTSPPARCRAEHQPARVVVQALRLARGELALDLALQRGVAFGPAQRSSSLRDPRVERAQRGDVLRPAVALGDGARRSAAPAPLRRVREPLERLGEARVVLGVAHDDAAVAEDLGGSVARGGDDGDPGRGRFETDVREGVVARRAGSARRRRRRARRRRAARRASARAPRRPSARAAPRHARVSSLPATQSTASPAGGGERAQRGVESLAPEPRADEEPDRCVAGAEFGAQRARPRRPPRRVEALEIDAVVEQRRAALRGSRGGASARRCTMRELH